MKYFLIAGEASGDIHAAQLIKALMTQDSEAEFRFFGGDFMAQASGVLPEVHYKDMAFMGFIEVIKHLGSIMGFLKISTKIIDAWKPDAVVLVDYPSFNLKVAKYAHSLGVPVYYYISPKVWAWKEYRVKQIKEYISELYSILPFETEFYDRHGYHVEYVGNPTVNEIADAKNKFKPIADFCSANGLDDNKSIIALIPGSRKKEIRDNLKEMLNAVARFPEYQAVVGGAPGLSEEFYNSVFKKIGCGGVSPKVLFGKSFELVHHARAALVTSGTATLETAILKTPQIVCYRMGGSKLVYTFYSHLLKVKYVSLPNLIADDEVVPELLLHNCNADRITEELKPLLENDSEQLSSMLNGYERIASRLTDARSAETAASRMIANLRNSHSR